MLLKVFKWKYSTKNFMYLVIYNTYNELFHSNTWWKITIKVNCLFVFHMFPLLAVLHLHSTVTSAVTCIQSLRSVSVCCLQSIVSFQGHFNAIQKFANQLFCSSAYQTGLSSSSVRPVSLFVRFFCHSSLGWQKHCISDPSSFYRLFFGITTGKTHCPSEDLLLFSNIS